MVKRSKGQEQWNRATEKEILGQLIGVKGRMNEVGRQGTDHVRQGTQDGNKGQSRETGKKGRETKYSTKT